MLDDADLVQMQAELLEVIGDHAQSIVIRRGETTLPAQVVRIEFMGTGRSGVAESAYAEETRSRVNVVGGVDLDIKKDDRFNAFDSLFKVTAVRSNRQIGTMAVADMIQ